MAVKGWLNRHVGDVANPVVRYVDEVQIGFGAEVVFAAAEAKADGYGCKEGKLPHFELFLVGISVRPRDVQVPMPWVGWMLRSTRA